MFAAELWWQGVWNLFPFLMGPKHATKDIDLIFSTNLYALEHLHVVQIWIMHIKCLENPVNV